MTIEPKWRTESHILVCLLLLVILLPHAVGASSAAADGANAGSGWVL